MKQIQLPKNIPIITKTNIKLLFPNISIFTFDQNIKNWLKSGRLLALKKGLYVFGDYLDDNKKESLYLEWLANQIYQPSYLSKEYMLQKYGVLTEAVYVFTSVSQKTSRSFNNKLGSFNYYSIQPKLFVGWKAISYGDKIVYVASRSKALFDYLYFYKRVLFFINEKQIEGLRLNLDEYDKKDWQEFEQYLSVAKSTKLNKIYKLIKKVYVNGGIKNISK